MEKIRFWEKKSKAKCERAWMVKVIDLGVQSEQSELVELINHIYELKFVQSTPNKIMVQ